MTPDVLLNHTYSVIGGDTATPIREFQDTAGTTWLEAIFARGHEETLERHPKPAFRSLVLQERR